MDEKDFRKHLRDLAHGHHHPEEHDWSTNTNVPKSDSNANPESRRAAKTKGGTAKKRKRAINRSGRH
jgi:hypothetical protein